MSRRELSEKPSAVLLWSDDEGHYQSVYLSKARVILVLSLLTLSSLWAISATAYVFFRDEILISLAHKHNDKVSHYEDRLALMRAQTDRITSKQLLDQDVFEKKMAVLFEKQNTLEAQQKIIRDFTSRIGGSTQASLDTPKNRFFLNEESGVRAANNLNQGLVTITQSLNHLNATQEETIKASEEVVKIRQKGLLKLFNELNLPIPSMPEATGGPFISAYPSLNIGFVDRIATLEKAMFQYSALQREAKKLPISRPLSRDHEITSGFGSRVDPFNRGYAQHSGIDFRGSTGDPVRATGAGTVITAQSQGGYGLMVEIEHGHDFTTRYAHLSGMNVVSGDRVAAGQIIGQIGSTGRSTGPHLHYEIRRDGSALDPITFLRLGR